MIWPLLIVPILWLFSWLTYPKQDPTLFLESHLALPVICFDPGGSNFPNQRKEFLRQYKWIHKLLEKSYPYHEFLIVPKDLEITPESSWEKIEGFTWRGHILYKRPLKRKHDFTYGAA